MALMHLFADWAKEYAAKLPVALIVDHGLRDDSDKEAALAAQWAQDAGLVAHVLRRKGPRPRANIEDEARSARYALMGAWCERRAVQRIFLAHTLDDQAETFLLRLGRGSGVDGLSGMRGCGPLPAPGFSGIEVLRPLLDVRREELRRYLKAREASWLEDPMNADPRFARTRIREVLPALEAAGISAPRIAQAARHLARAREALNAGAAEFLAVHAQGHSDSVLIDGASLGRLPRETGLRVLSAVLMRVSGAVYRPRFERLTALYKALTSGSFAKARTLHTCRIGKASKADAVFGPETLEITREMRRKTACARKSAGVGPETQRRTSRSKSPHKGRNILVQFKS
jgi:tRNA(Ile)-lysidine synthase